MTTLVEVPVSRYPIVYEQDPAIERNQMTVFFRIIMVIPHLFLVVVYAAVAAIAVVLAWCAIVVTGHYPKGMYGFVASVIRYLTRVMGYVALVTDEYPPFDRDEHPEYPVRLEIAPQPQERYSRPKTFFRIILMFPVVILLGVFNYWMVGVMIVTWLVAIFTGRTFRGLGNAMLIPLSYRARAIAYLALLTDTWPVLEP